MVLKISQKDLEDLEGLRMKDLLAKYDADLESCLKQLRSQYLSAEEGYVQEKVSNRAETGVVQLIERYPELMLRITQERLRLWKYLEEKEAMGTGNPGPLVVRFIRAGGADGSA